MFWCGQVTARDRCSAFLVAVSALGSMHLHQRSISIKTIWNEWWVSQTPPGLNPRTFPIIRVQDSALSRVLTGMFLFILSPPGKSCILVSVFDIAAPLGEVKSTLFFFTELGPIKMAGWSDNNDAIGSLWPKISSSPFLLRIKPNLKLVRSIEWKIWLRH